MEPKASPPSGPPRGAGGKGEQRFPKWAIWVLIGLVIGVLAISSMASRGSGTEISYSEFMDQVSQDKVASISFDNTTGRISGEYKDGTNFRTTGYLEFPDEDLQTLREHNVDVKPKTPQSSLLGSILPFLLPFGLLILFFWWMQRRAAGQMGNIMSIGRSRAKTYSTERPSTTFDDVAGYEGVKQEIREIIDFLRAPQRFAAVGARAMSVLPVPGGPTSSTPLGIRAPMAAKRCGARRKSMISRISCLTPP